MAILKGSTGDNTIGGSSLDDVVLGYAGDDALGGSDGNDSIFGGSGDDILNGQNGNDFLNGDRGADDLYGSFGNDRLFGGLGADGDFLYGGDGEDTLYGGQGFDFLDGGVGDDTIVGVDPATGWTSSVGYSWGRAGVTVNLAQGFAIDEFGDRDSLVNIRDVDGTDRADRITGDAGDNFITGHAGGDTINGGGGIDEVNYNTGGTQGITANLISGNVTDNFGNTDRLTGIENLRGSAFDDRVIGSTAGNTFRGLDGDDVIDGGSGYDAVWFDRDLDFGGSRGVEVDLAGGFAFDGFGKLDSLIRIEGVRGSLLSDSITGSNAANTLTGEQGDDTVFGGNGDDVVGGGQGRDRLFGGAGIDTLSMAGDEAAGASFGAVVNLATGRADDGFGDRDTLGAFENVEGSSFADTITGSSAVNTLSGGAGNDSLLGGAGRDVLAGGDGNDRMAGQSATDTFAFGEDYGSDRIDDFSIALGEVLDYSANRFVDGLADLTIVQQGANTLVTSADGSVLLVGVTATDLTAAHFVF
jgi:Ca2+-binding RTX toxin-like protein